MKASSTERYLKGKRLPGLDSKVSKIFARGPERIVVLADRTRITYDKSGLKKQMQVVMSESQKVAMSRTLRRQPDGTVRMTIGGAQKGVRKTYVSEAAARSALTRRYGK